MGQALITFFFGRLNGDEARPPKHHHSSASFSTGISSSSSSSGGGGGALDPASADQASPPASAAVTAAAAAASAASGHGGALSSSLFNRKPTKMEDFEINSCYACSVPFDMLVRRHHCRRCWNIYCQKCSSQRDRLLLFGEPKPVRLCDDCYKEAPAENRFFEKHLPLLLEGAAMVKGEQNALLASTPWRRRRQQQQVYLRVIPDLSALEETEEEELCPGSRGGAAAEGAADGGPVRVSGERSSGRGAQGITRYHSLADIECVDAVAEVSGWGGGGCEEDGSAPALVIRFRGKGQLKLEASNPHERDRWVSGLGEAVRRLRAPSLADAVEQERWQRKEDAAAEAQRLENAQRRRENETSRAKMAVKYGLDPNKYAAAAAGSGRRRQSAAAQQRQPLRAASNGE
ncbi:unnamed protein product, partial [Scytosiphon promiscuus]